jgi:hypothetical protein
MLITMSQHVLDPVEQRYDHQPPGDVPIQSVKVVRGKPTKPGQWVEDADTGQILLYLGSSADNRTPPERMGYRIRHVGGTLPKPDMVPRHDVDAIRLRGGGPFLAFYWNDPAVAGQRSFTFLLSVAAVDLAGNVGSRTIVAVGDPAVVIPPPDQIPYDVASLRIVDEGAGNWLLTDGRSRIQMFDGQQDASNGLAVVSRYTRQGFVGRGNRRPDRESYLLPYWAGASGLPPRPVTSIDRIHYNPDNLFAADLGSSGWRIQDGANWLSLADNAGDAAAQLQIMIRYHWMCYIGRNNHRPSRQRYMMTYWE